MPLHRPDAKFVFPKGASKAIILGFDSEWYLCPLRETGLVRYGQTNPPQREFRHYKTRDGVMKAAYDYATSGQLTSRQTIPPELEDAYQQSLANQEE